MWQKMLQIGAGGGGGFEPVALFKKGVGKLVGIKYIFNATYSDCNDNAERIYIYDSNSSVSSNVIMDYDFSSIIGKGRKIKITVNSQGHTGNALVIKKCADNSTAGTESTKLTLTTAETEFELNVDDVLTQSNPYLGFSSYFGGATRFFAMIYNIVVE